MRRFVLLILHVCLFINDKIVIAKSKDVINNNTDSDKFLNVALEKCFKVKVKKLNLSNTEYYGNVGFLYETEKKKLFFVKQDYRNGSDKKFHGEYEGLKAIRDTKTVLAPTPFFTGGTGNKSQHFIAMDYIMNISLLDDEYSALLGSQIADLHLHNLQPNSGKEPIKKFGFHAETRIGFGAQNNTWTDDWITFFTVNRLEYQIELLKSNSDEKKKEVLENFWPRLKPMIPELFKGIDVKPSLLHGDLWVENTARWLNKPVVFDPAAFYGHHEFDISTTKIFGSFTPHFYMAYFKKIPKAEGFDKRRILYQLYVYLINWNQFNGIYPSLVILSFRDLLNDFKDA